MTKKVSKATVRRSAQTRKSAKKRRSNSQLVYIAGALILFILVIAAYFFWRQRDTPSNSQEARALANVEPVNRNNYYSQYPEMVIDNGKSYEAIIRTDSGNMRLRLFDDESPLTVNNFVFLAKQGFYDGLTFHRVIQDFMAQGGDPTGLGSGGPGYQFADETDNGLVFDRPGLLAMANAGPNTNGSQFFITFVPTPHLNGGHTIFGELIEGQDVLNSLTLIQPGGGEIGDVIERIDIIER